MNSTVKVLHCSLFAIISLVSSVDLIYLGVPRKTGEYAMPFTLDASKQHYLCQIASRGPCAKNQKFALLNESLSYSPRCEDLGQSCQTAQLLRGRLQRCISADKYTSSKGSKRIPSKGICVWANSKHPCNGYPASYRFHSSTKTCYSAGSLSISSFRRSIKQDESPCTGGKSQQFTATSRNRGECQCMENREVYWPQNGKCYTVNTQGPCASGHWLASFNGRKARCLKTSCPADGSHVIHEDSRAGTQTCHQLFTLGPCKSNEFVYQDERNSAKLACLERPAEGRRVIAQAPKRTCPRGRVLSRDGSCKRIFGVFRIRRPH